jgi:putative spermidine/putrescine transport system permease protein
VVRNKNNGWRMLVLGLSLVPFLMGDVVRAFGWLLLLGTDGAYGWTTGLLLGDRFTLIGSPVGEVVGMLQTMTPICIFVLLPAIRRIDPDTEKAAETLGAKPWTVWIRVVMPLLRPGMAAAAVVAFALTTTQYAIPEMIGGGHLPFAANAIQSAFFSQGNINLGSAQAILMLIIVIVFVGIVGSASATKVRHPDKAGDAAESKEES